MGRRKLGADRFFRAGPGGREDVALPPGKPYLRLTAGRQGRLVHQ